MMVGDKMRLSNYSPYLNSKARINLRQASIINSLGIIYRGRRVKNNFGFDPLRCPAVWQARDRNINIIEIILLLQNIYEH
jgi:hypothetical protein